MTLKPLPPGETWTPPVILVRSVVCFLRGMVGIDPFSPKKQDPRLTCICIHFNDLALTNTDNAKRNYNTCILFECL